MRVMSDSRGAFHFLGLVVLLLIGAAIYALTAWNAEIAHLRAEVDRLNQRVTMLESKL